MTEVTQKPEVRVEMQCADEALAVRTFVQIGEGDEIDYACEHCGFLQQSTAAGAGELCRLGTWHSKNEYAKYAAVARAGGQIVPDEPPNFAA